MKFLQSPKVQAIKKEVIRRNEYVQVSDKDIEELERVFFENSRDLKEIKEFIKKCGKYTLLDQNIKKYLINGLNNWKKIDRIDKCVIAFCIYEMNRGNIELEL